MNSMISFDALESLLSAGVRLAVPLLLGALGETISQKSGTLNIGLESSMISGAFFGFAVTYLSGSIAPVSYTHLDVYKRQRQRRWNPPSRIMRLRVTRS